MGPIRKQTGVDAGAAYYITMYNFFITSPDWSTFSVYCQNLGIVYNGQILTQEYYNGQNENFFSTFE